LPTSPVIVGYDPGETAAIVALDFQGQLLLLRTFKGGNPKAVELLRSHQIRPVIMASDKARQASVAKLATSFKARPYFPDRDLSIPEKTRLTSGLRFGNDHERDALAAALQAFRVHQSLINRVVSALLNREVANVRKAVEALDNPPHQPKTPSKPPSRSAPGQEARIKALELKVALLKNRLEARQTQVAELKTKLARADRRFPVPGKTLSGQAKAEREARLRLEVALADAHSRVLGIEAEMQKLKQAVKRGDRDRQEDIRQQIFRMIADYKQRFRK